MHPVINLADKLSVLENKPHQVSMEDVSSFLRFALDSVTLMAHSVYELNLCSRELIRPKTGKTVVRKPQSVSSCLEVTCLRLWKRLVKPTRSVRGFLNQSTELIQSMDQTDSGDKGHIQIVKNIFCTLANPRGESHPRNSERGREQINKNIQSSSVGKQGEPP